MTSVNPTSTIYRLSSNEMINTGNAALLSDIAKDDTTDFSETPASQQTETSKQTQKEEMK